MILFAILIGTSLACQSAVNSKLRTYVISPFMASMISFFAGALALTVLSFTSGYLFWEEWGLLKGQPLWLITGGFLGVFALTMNIILFPIIGGVQAAVLPIVGQIIMGVIIDQFGLVYSPVHPLTVTKVIGLILVIGGVLFATETFTSKQSAVKGNIGWKLLGVLAGMLGALQASVNGRLGVVLESPLLSAQISFFVGLITLFIICLLTKAKFSLIADAIKVGWKKSWIFIGGFLGATYVFGAAMLAPIIGTGQLVIFALFGQLLGSLIIEKFGLFNSYKRAISRSKMIGLILLLAGVFTIKFV